MVTLTLENIDKHFSPELLALMGEWFTYFRLKSEIGICQDERPTIRGFFDIGIISAHGAFTDDVIEYGPSDGKIRVYLEHFMESYGVTRESRDDTISFQHIKPIVSYDDVKETFRKNLSPDKTPIFPWFAYYSRVFLPNGENVVFSCDVDCFPLIEAFCTEGYMARRAEAFYWTPKIRALMEILGQWKTEQELDAQAREAEEIRRTMSMLDQLYEKAFEESFKTEDFTPLIIFVKEYYPVISLRSDRALKENGIASVIPIIGLVVLFDSLDSKERLLSFDSPNVLVADFSETSEAMKILRRNEFWKVMEVFMPERIDPDRKIDPPPKVYKLPWSGEHV